MRAGGSSPTAIRSEAPRPKRATAGMHVTSMRRITARGSTIRSSAPTHTMPTLTLRYPSAPGARGGSVYDRDGEMRVLVAEDNDLVRGALCGMLRVMSAAVVEAKSGKELIHRVFGAEHF